MQKITCQKRLDVENILFSPYHSSVKYICDVLHDLVPFVQFKKREKQP